MIHNVWKWTPFEDGVMVSYGEKTMVMPGITVAQFEVRMQWWMEKGMNIQDAFPMLSDDQREFLMTGLTPEEWDDLFGEEEE